MNFEDLIESHDVLFDDIDSYIDDFILENIEDEELLEIIDELGINLEEGDIESIDDDDFDRLQEELRRRVTARGDVSRVKSRKVRARRANQTTGISKSARRKRARKAARTRRRNPGTVRKAIKKRNRALRKRKQMNL